MVSEDDYVHVKRTAEAIMFLTLYVDDMFMVRNNLEMNKATKK